ncbi:MAG: DUF6345 domain-containing protein [Dehalococcoidia bacterium]|nr:DUF6345 domain-containing protein [Dehalococcoidia bacterium]
MRKCIFSLLMISVILIQISVMFASPAFADDDANSYEVSTYAVEVYPQPDVPDLNFCCDDALGFRGILQQEAGFTIRDGLENGNVHEEMFKKAASGGDDQNHVDAADIVYYSGHGADYSSDISAPRLGDTTHDDEWVLPYECYWGDQDVEWILLHCCKVLRNGSAGYWGLGAMHGSHLICGAKNTIYDYGLDGYQVAWALVGNGPYCPAVPVKDAWFWGGDIYQPSSVQLRVIGENDQCGNDYIWDNSYDPSVDSWKSVWDYTCT